MRHPVCHLETEEEYFHRLDVELIDDMRRRAAFEERHQRMAEACQTADPRILAALEKLGYDQDAVTLLYFAPLVQVAWLDGSVNQAERNRIRVMASLQGIRENLSAYRQLMEWLDRRPSDEFFNGTLDVIRMLLEALPEYERKARTETLIRRCREIAFAACGLFGWKSKICFTKRTFIRELANLLEAKPKAASARAGT